MCIQNVRKPTIVPESLTTSLQILDKLGDVQVLVSVVSIKKKKHRHKFWTANIFQICRIAENFEHYSHDVDSSFLLWYYKTYNNILVLQRRFSKETSL